MNQKNIIKAEVKFQVEKGPTVKISRDFELETYEPPKLEVPFGGGVKESYLGLGNQVSLLSINPEVNSKDYANLALTYEVVGIGKDADDNKVEISSGVIELKEPHVYMGKNAVSALLKYRKDTTSLENIEKIVFRNNQAQPEDTDAKGILISIFIIRDT